MSVKVTGAMLKLSRIEARVRHLETSLAGKMTAAAEDMGQRSLHRSVYGTVPGRVYIRTGHLRDLFRVQQAGQARIRITSGADYASGVEKIAPEGLSFYAASGRAAGMGGWQPSSATPPYFGRTGRSSWFPGPHVGPAGLRALWIARQEVIKAIKQP